MFSLSPGGMKDLAEGGRKDRPYEIATRMPEGRAYPHIPVGAALAPAHLRGQSCRS